VTDWTQQQVDSLNSLRGCVVLRWVAVETAAREVGVRGKPQWYDDSVPFLQLDRLDLLLSGGTVVSLATYQSDDMWGIHRCDGLAPLELKPSEPTSIFRTRILNELPVGEINSVGVLMYESRILAGVSLGVQGSNVLLRTGEVYEEADGSLRIVEMDESILVTVDGKMPRSGTPA